MDTSFGRYYKSSKFLLETVGLWPYGNLWKRNAASVAFQFCTLSLIISQFVLLTQIWKKDFDLMIELHIAILFNFGCLCKYQMSFFTASKLKSLLSEVVEDYQGIKDTYERELINKFYEEGNLMSFLYTAYLMGAWFSLHSVQFAPLILDYVFPLENGTRGKIIVTRGNYFSLDQEDYHYENCIYLSAVNLSLVTMVAGTDSIYVLTTKHVCGLMTVTGHRLNTIGKSDSKGAHDKSVINDIRLAVTSHRRAIRCCIVLEDAFSIVFLCHQILAILIMALTCFNLVFIPCTYFRLCQCFFVGCGMNVYMMFLNWVGQEIIDVSEKLMYAAYCSEWYLLSPEKRKLIAFVMIRLFHPSKLTIGKLSSLSMATYGQVMKSTITYVTALISLTLNGIGNHS